MNNTDYYKVLDVAPNASADEIKRAYRKKAQTYHPDVNKTPEAEGMMKQINVAYDNLSDANKRQQYDFYRRNPGQQPFNGQQQQYRGYSTQGSHDQQQMFEDFIRQFMNQQQYQQRQGAPQMRRVSPFSLLLRFLFTMYMLQLFMNFFGMLLFG